MSRPPLAVPVLGPEVPRRGNAFSLWAARVALRLTGWRFAGQFPNVPKFILVVAPHTSNWDFPIGLMAMFALQLRAVFLAKHTMFRRPFAGLMNWLGGVPIDRRSVHNVVDQMVAYFAAHERVVMIVAPEGTRKRIDRWRTGFYHIAKGAGVPLVPIAFDYSTRTFRISAPITPSPDAATDFGKFRECFHASMAKHPHQYTEV